MAICLICGRGWRLRQPASATNLAAMHRPVGRCLGAAAIRDTQAAGVNPATTEGVSACSPRGEDNRPTTKHRANP